MLEVVCEGLPDGGRFPVDYTGRGADRSPAFVLKNLSSRARTLVITLEDRSHPIKQFTHWVIWNIPAAERVPGGIGAGASVPNLAGARQGLGYGVHRYAGPKPPKGKSHKYVFTVYALDCALTIKGPTTKGNILRQAGPHIIQRGSVCGFFE